MQKIVGGIVLVSLLAAAGPVAANAAPAPPPDDGSTVRVIVTMRAPATSGGELSTAAVDASLATLDARLAGTDAQIVDELDTVPAALVEVDQAALAALRADPSVASVTVNGELRIQLASSTGVIRSDELNRAGIRGGRYEIAIIDTGVDKTHNALRGKVVAEACYSEFGGCEGGRTQHVGRGSATPCRFSQQCAHGTHVASTAAGRAFRGGHEGVAPDANIVAIRVGHPAGGGGHSLSFWDVDKALERVLRLSRAGRPIVAVNMSLGSNPLTPPQCRQFTQTPTHQLSAQLTARGVAVIAAAGNHGATGAIGFPACLPSVYAVSASTDGDRRANFSNLSSQTDWYAPGVNVDAAVPGPPNAEGRMNGTSMSTPHVAGAFALLRQCPGNKSPAAVAKDLNATGRRISSGGIVRRRIDVLAAASRNVPNDHFARARRIRFRGAGVDLAGSNVCATRQRGEGGPGKAQNSVWFSWRPARKGRAIISTDSARRKPTTFNTELNVFVGNSPSRLRSLRYDNNGGRGSRSKITMRVKRNQVYKIRVDGFGGQTGRFNLHVRLSR